MASARTFPPADGADERGHVSSEAMSGFFKQAWQSAMGGQDGANGAVGATPPESAAIDPAARPDADGGAANAQPKAELAPAAAAVSEPLRADQGPTSETAIKSDEKPDVPGEIEEDRAPDTVNGGSDSPDTVAPAPGTPSENETGGRKMLTPQDAVNVALVGRCIDVLWPEDGTWWKARVIKLNPVTGMATLYYEPKDKEDGGEEDAPPAEEGEKKSDPADPDPNDARPPAEPKDAEMADATKEPDLAEDKKDGEGAGEEEDEEDEEGEGEIEELDLREAAGNQEVCWSASEVERMKLEYEAILNGGPIAPADKVAVPCPHCDKRAFKYLRSMEKHVWNEHGVKLTREEMDAFEKALRAGATNRGPMPSRRRAPALPEIITINYDEMYDILTKEDGETQDDEAVMARAKERVRVVKEASEKTRLAGGPEGQRATLWAAGDHDLCHICGEADPDFWNIENDCIVMCDGCDVQVHLSCYGLSEVPEGEWFCQGCIDGIKVGKDRPADAGMCSLCPVPGGVLSRVQPPSRWNTAWGADGTHAHLCCANSLGEAIVTPSTTCAPVIDMHRVKNSRMILNCGLCNLAGGCVQCSMKNCFQGFHPLCARSAGLVRLYPDKEDMHSPPIFFCAEHSAPAFAQRRYKAAGMQAPVGMGASNGNLAGMAQAPSQISLADIGGARTYDAMDNEERMAMNSAMKSEGAKIELRKAKFVARLWHRFVPFLPQPIDPNRRVDMHKRSGTFCRRVMTRAKVPEKEQERIAKMTDDECEKEVTIEMDAARKKALGDAKKGSHLNEGLRMYQREGVAWLAAQHSQGAGGGILGDDMGLGKTLQVLSFLQYLRDAKGESGPHLVVCPLSVLPTWVTESKRWCPSLRAVAFHGPEAERNRLKQEVLVQGTFDVLVTTYEMLTAEQSMLANRFHFRYMVLDEAQRVKNDSSLVSQAVRRIRTTASLLLTGTPLQNNLHELRALVSVLFQEVLEAAGAEKMEVDADAAFGDDSAVAAARALLQPLMLRRTKAAVLAKDLPPKTETVVRVPLSDAQRQWYKTLLEGEKGLFGKLASTNATSEKGALGKGMCIAEAADEQAKVGGQEFTKLSNLLMQLRKVCCHPFTFGDDAAKAIIAASGGDRVEALIEASGKLKALDEMLPRLRAGGHKVLIFSQFTMMLDMLEEFCEARGHAHLRLDGSTSLSRRRYETALFNKPDGRHFVYLCSTRAGGLGINLQSADTVILADPDWNPTYDQQAQDRAHRLGQKRPVTVIRMCHANSVEEGILAVAARKAGLAAAVLAGLEAGADVEALDAAAAAAGQDPATAAKLSFAELREIIISGANAAELPGPPERKATRSSKTPSKTPAKSTEDAQAEGAAALARAAQSTGKKGHYQWEGMDYTTSAAKGNKKDIADLWVEELGGGRRQRVSTVEMVDAGFGLGMQAVSRASLQEAREAEDRERRAASAREHARLRAADRASRHETICCECKGDEENGCNKPAPAFLAPDVAAERLRCRNCPRTMSLGCARLVTRPRMGWQCPQHHCKSCNRTASEAGGLLFRCVDCPIAFCAECNGETPFDAVEGNPEWEALGFYLPKSFEYVRCNDCVVEKEVRDKEEKKRREAEERELKRNPKLAKQKREAEAKAKAEAERKAKEAEEQARAEAEAKAKAEEEAKKPKPPPKPKVPGQAVRCEICARAKKGGCGTDRAHSKCLKLKQNGGDIDIGDAKGGEAKTPAAKAPPAKSSPSSNTKGDKKRKR